jgi:antitoxin component YwqK of YwqJK toxin-antitoxin module
MYFSCLRQVVGGIVGAFAMRASVVWLAGLLIVAVGFSGAYAQNAGEEEKGDDAPVERQSESVKVEPYKGPPIFLPKTPDPIPPREVERRVVIDFHPIADGTRPDAVSLTLPEARGFEPTGADGRQAHVQRTVTRYSDESFKNEGPYKEYYANGQVFVEGTYSEGKKSGDWKFFHPNGTEAKTITYENGVPHGVIEVHDADGVLIAVREFNAGKRSGTWKTFDKTGAQILTERHYKDGLPDGLWQIWHANGQLASQQPYVAGKLSGNVISWDDKGKKLNEGTFVDGQRDGVARQWLADGRVVEQTYERGKLVASKIKEK